MFMHAATAGWEACCGRAYMRYHGLDLTPKRGKNGRILRGYVVLPSIDR